MTAVDELQKYLSMNVSRLIIDYTFDKSKEDYKIDFDQVLKLLKIIQDKSVMCDICNTFMKNAVVTNGQYVLIRKPNFIGTYDVKIVFKKKTKKKKNLKISCALFPPKFSRLIRACPTCSPKIKEIKLDIDQYDESYDDIGSIEKYIYTMAPCYTMIKYFSL